MEKVLVIAGPTAVGKTALSIQLAKRFNGEVISGDSMQVYRQLDIGTAKASMVEREGIPHYLIDCRALNETYSAADFQKEGREKIKEITERGKLPIIVGGTGLYIQSLLYDFELGGRQQATSEQLRKKYEQFAEKEGNEALWQQLAQIDPLAAAAIHFNNRRKVIRALEVFETTGQSIVAPKEQPKAMYDFYFIGLTTDRDLLYQRINQRVDEMMNQGLLEEAKLLYTQPSVQAAQGIGYKELFPYLQGSIELKEAVDQVKQNSRRYAKRQLTWFRNRLPVHWFDLLQHPDTQQKLEQAVAQWLES